MCETPSQGVLSKDTAMSTALKDATWSRSSAAHPVSMMYIHPCTEPTLSREIHNMQTEALLHPVYTKTRATRPQADKVYAIIFS